MTVSAPARLNPIRGFGTANLAHRRPPHSQHVLSVEFTSPDGRTCHAIGGGDTLADAIAFAQDSCPSDTTWQPINRSDLYGD